MLTPTPLKMADLMADVPYELVMEITLYLEYGDVQSFRATCRRISKVIEHLALKRLNIDFEGMNQDGLLDFPLEKFNAYSDPNLTRGFHFVRHLEIKGLCIDFSAPRCSYEDKTGCYELLLRLPRPHEHKEVIYRRIKMFYEVMDKFFTSPALMNLETITWRLPACKLHPNRKFEGDCSKTANQLFPLVLRERGTPLRKFDLFSSSGALPKFPILPLTKELRIRGLPGYKPSTTATNNLLDWVEESILNDDNLEVIEWDITLNKPSMERLFGSKRGPGISKNIKHQRLNLCHRGGRLTERYMAPFRSLRNLQLVCDEDKMNHPSPALCEGSLAPLWVQLVEEQIFVEELHVYLNEVGQSFVDYIASYPKYPKASISFLRMRSRSGEPNHAHLDTIPQQFYSRALPVVAPRLDQFTLKTYQVNNWSFGVLPESIEAYKQCKRLDAATITMKPSEDIDEIVRGVFNGFEYLPQVVVYSPTKSDEEATHCEKETTYRIVTID